MSGPWVIVLSMGAIMELSLDHPVDPGWDLDELFDLEPGEYPADGLFTAITAVAKAEAMLHAKKLELLAALHAAKRDDDDVEWLADTVAADNHTTIARARGELELARKLTTRLPETLRLLAAGKLDVPRVRQLDELTIGLSDEHCAELAADIFPLAVDKTPRQLTTFVKRKIVALDPDAANQRSQQAKRDRRVCIEPAPDGMAWLAALLPAEDAHAASTRIDSIARGLDLPGDLRGYGPLPAERIRELAYTLRARWVGVLTDPDGHPQAMAPSTYRFRGRLAEYIRLRDGTCTHPACNQPAHKCDIDHVIPRPRGQTTPDNASTECRRHHREKHETTWTVHREKNTTTWTHNNGRQLTNTPQPLPVQTPF